MTELFPTFARIWPGPWNLPLQLSTPWWPADTLASKQRSLLRVLSVATAERLELAPLVGSLAEEHRGRYRRRLKRLAQRLAAATALPEALEQTPGALSDEQVLAVRFAIQSGTLCESLRSLVKRGEQPSNQIGHRMRQIGFYGTLVSAFFLLVLSFMMIKIIPSFRAIFDDFELSLPRLSELLIRISVAAVNYWYAIVLALIFAVWLVRSEISRRFFRRRVLSRMLPTVVQLRSADLLSLLAVAHQAGRPLPGAISTLARYHYDSLIRHKLLFVRNEVEQGAELSSSLAAAGLLSPAESRALASSTSTDTTVWTLRCLADWKQTRVARRFDTYVDFLLPAVVLFMASIVLFTAMATLLPLFELTMSLS